MRADVNLSVREVGAEEFGTRTEMKNLNSFKAIARAIEGERERQIELIEEGKAVHRRHAVGMTTKNILTPCVPRKMPKTTDISLIQICLQSISLMHGLKRIKAEQPELREVKQARYQEEYGLPAYDAGILTESRHLAGLF